MNNPVSPLYIPRILIIDDEKYNIEFLQIVLSQSGYKVESARSGAQGRLMALEFQPDIILLDIMMPAESGFETCALLKQNPATCNIPIIFLTALDDRKNISRGLDAGATDFIAKPFEYREVLNRIRIHLKITFNEKVLFSNEPPHRSNTTGKIQIENLPNICVYNEDHPDQSGLSCCEIAVMNQNIQLLLLIEFEQGKRSYPSKEKIREIFAANIGPHFTPSETLRNIGLSLSKISFFENTEAKLIYLDRDNERATVVNAGGAPVIHLKGDSDFTFIEPQTAGLGATGLGLPPASTIDLESNHRLILCTTSLLSDFKTVAAGTVELQNTAVATAGVDIETACEAIGRTIIKADRHRGQLAILQQ